MLPKLDVGSVGSTGPSGPAAGRSVGAAETARAAAMVRPAALTIARDLVKTRGVAGLYAGVGPSVLRAFLVSGSRFTAYEFAMSHF